MEIHLELPSVRYECRQEYFCPIFRHSRTQLCKQVFATGVRKVYSRPCEVSLKFSLIWSSIDESFYRRLNFPIFSLISYIGTNERYCGKNFAQTQASIVASRLGEVPNATYTLHSMVLRHECGKSQKQRIADKIAQAFSEFLLAFSRGCYSTARNTSLNYELVRVNVFLRKVNIAKREDISRQHRESIRSKISERKYVTRL